MNHFVRSFLLALVILILALSVGLLASANGESTLYLPLLTTPRSTWAATFDVPDLARLLPLADGELLAVSVGGPPSATRLDSQGNVRWHRTLDLNALHGADTTGDGGLVVSGGNGVLRLDGDGQFLWYKRYGDVEASIAWLDVRALEGGYLIAGSADPPDGGLYEPWIARLDEEGGIIWQKQLDDGEPLTGHVFDLVRPLADGGALTAVSGNADWLVRFDAAGNLLWQKRVSSPAPMLQISDAIPTPDGNFLVVGRVLDSCHSALLMKLNGDGELLWDRHWGCPAYLDAISAAPDGTYLAAGYSATSTLARAWVVRLSLSGDLIWQRMISRSEPGQGGWDHARDVAVGPDGRFAFAITSCPVGGCELLIMQPDGSGDINGCPMISPETAPEVEVNLSIAASNFTVADSTALAFADTLTTEQHALGPTILCAGSDAAGRVPCDAVSKQGIASWMKAD